MPLDRSEARDAAGRSEDPVWVTAPPTSPASMPTAVLPPGLPAFRPANGHSQCIADQAAAEALSLRRFPPGIALRVHSGAAPGTRNRSRYDARPAEECVPVPIA